MALPINIVLCGDRNVLWGMAVTVRSALEQSTSPIAINIIGSGLLAVDIDALRGSWDHPNVHSINFMELDYRNIKHFRSTKYLKSKVCYARYFIENLFPNIERIIYLDTDLLVLADLVELYKTDLGSNIVGVVLDISTRSNDGQVEPCQKLGIEPRGYFNSGVMLIDMKAWKKERIKEQLIDVSITHFDRLDSQDQSALNIVLQGKALILDERWNTVQYETESSFTNGIVHLIGSVKPWHYDYKGLFQPLFFQTLDRTAYAGCRPAKALSFFALRTAANRHMPTVDMVVGKLRRLFQLGRATKAAIRETALTPEQSDPPSPSQ